MRPCVTFSGIKVKIFDLSTLVYTRLGTRLHSSAFVYIRLWLVYICLHSYSLVWWLVYVFRIDLFYNILLSKCLDLYRSSHPEVFCRKGVFRNFAKFTRNHLRQSFIFDKVTGLRPATLLIIRLLHRCFPENFAKFLRTLFSTEHLQWLLLIYN